MFNRYLYILNQKHIAMNNFITNLMNAARKFTVTDFAIFKICLLAIGVLLGTYFSSFLTEHILIIWIIAAITYVILMIQVIRYYKKSKN